MKKGLKYALWSLVLLALLALAVVAGAAGSFMYLKYYTSEQAQPEQISADIVSDDVQTTIEEHIYLNAEENQVSAEEIPELNQIVETEAMVVTDAENLTDTTDQIETEQALIEPDVNEKAEIVEVEPEEETIEADVSAMTENVSIEIEGAAVEELSANGEDVPAADVVENVSETVDAPQIVAEEQDTRPMLAIVIDDMGVNQRRTRDMLRLEAPLTSSFLTYGRDLARLTEWARKSGHEVMLHAAMEPKIPANLAPDTLKTSMSESEIETVFHKMLDKFKGVEIKGVNNHMGSKFTENKEKLGYVMSIIKNNGMYFLDSKTTAATKGPELAVEDEVPFVVRDVFLDNKNERRHIEQQLKQVEKIAKNRGYAVAICHPKSQTYIVLKEWLKTLPDKDIRLVHLNQLVAQIRP